MSYVTNATVAAIAGISVDDVSSVLVGITDAHIETMLGYDMDDGAQSREQYFDVLKRNEFYTNYDGNLDFVLDRFPVIAVSEVLIDPDSNTDALSASDYQYWINTDASIVRINTDTALETGQRMLKVTYTWGYVTIPADVQSYANMHCAMLHNSYQSVAQNASGNNLKEIEMGRFRELYDIKNESVKSKYELLGLFTTQDALISKYRIWD